MARPYYREVPGGIFHVTSRGNARQTVFEDAVDCRRFIAELRHTVARHRWRCLSYCLMGNHFHLLVQTPNANLAAGMRDLKSQYATSYNARHGRDGSRFKPRYWRQLIQENDYLVTAAAYIALNPVRAGRTTLADAWPWSSFAATIAGERTFVDPQPILNLLHRDPIQARLQYRDLVHELAGTSGYDPSLPIVGDRDFVTQHAPAERPERDVPNHVWEQARPSLEELDASLGDEAFISEARRTHRYTLKEIARHLGCSERTVRRRLRVSGAETRPL